MSLVAYQKNVYDVCMSCHTCIYNFVLHKLMLYLITILKTRESVISHAKDINLNYLKHT